VVKQEQQQIKTFGKRLQHQGKGKMAKEKNDEYSMARNQLRTAMTAIKRLMKHVEGEGELKAWVQSKLTKAADYMDSVADYMDSNDKVVKEARELSSDIHTILEAKNPGFPGGPRAVADQLAMGRAVAAAAKQPKKPLPKRPSSKPPRVSAKEQSRRNLSKALSSNQEHHVDLASHRQILNSNGAELSGHSFDIMMDHSFQQAKAKHEDDKLEYFKERSRRVDMVASHVIRALKRRHSAHDIHELLSSHVGNDAILHGGGHRHPMHTTMVKQARSMMHDELKKEGLHEIAKQYAPEKPGIFRRIGQKLGLSEGYSVGEMGTDELVNRYKAMTPGQEKDKKTIETIKRVVESRRREFRGGYVGPGSTPDEEPKRLGSKPGPKSLGGNPGKRRTIRLHIG